VRRKGASCRGHSPCCGRGAWMLGGEKSKPTAAVESTNPLPRWWAEPSCQRSRRTFSTTDCNEAAAVCQGEQPSGRLVPASVCRRSVRFASFAAPAWGRPCRRNSVSQSGQATLVGRRSQTEFGDEVQIPNRVWGRGSDPKQILGTRFGGRSFQTELGNEVHRVWERGWAGVPASGRRRRLRVKRSTDLSPSSAVVRRRGGSRRPGRRATWCASPGSSGSRRPASQNPASPPGRGSACRDPRR